MRTIVATCAAVLVLSACSGGDIESRAREQAEKFKESMGEAETKALEQKATPDQVKRAQEALTAASEYQGEIDGKLDAVTVNAIEAFQRSHGLAGDGLLNDKTTSLLDEVLTKRKDVRDPRAGSGQPG